jgi:hypothetical protein
VKVKWRFLALALALVVIGAALLIGGIQVPGVIVTSLGLLAGLLSGAPGSGAAGVDGGD